MSKKNKTTARNILINKKAAFDYEFVEKIECGIVLEGTEVKSLREGRASFGSSYIKIQGNRMILMGFTIQPYSLGGSVFNHAPMRERYLLIKKQEMKHLRRKVEEKGMTIIPYRLYFKENLIKLEVCLCKGRDYSGKKQLLKERDIQRDAQREIKNIKRLS